MSGLFNSRNYHASFMMTSLMTYIRRSQSGVHVTPGVHLPIRRGTFRVSNRRQRYIYISFISKYLHIYQWI